MPWVRWFRLKVQLLFFESCDNDYADQVILLVLDRKDTKPDIDPSVLHPRNQKPTGLDPNVLAVQSGPCETRPVMPEDNLPQCPAGSAICAKEGHACLAGQGTCRTTITTTEYRPPKEKDVICGCACVDKDKR